jgi:hypothetical protein
VKVELSLEEREQRRVAAQQERQLIEQLLFKLGATPETAATLRPFFTADGKLTSIPMHRAKRIVLLDLMSQQFIPGQLYSEKRVNLTLGVFHPDWAAMRRYMVDEGFLERRDGFYWRAGGTFDLTPPT